MSESNVKKDVFGIDRGAHAKSGSKSQDVSQQGKGTIQTNPRFNEAH